MRSVSVLLLLTIASLSLSVPQKGPSHKKTLRDSGLDQMIDEMIYELGLNLIKEGKDKIRIPDIHEKYDKHIIGSWDFVAEIHMENGWFVNTTSLYRIGDAQEKDNPDGSMTFNLVLGMKEARVGNEDFNWVLGPTHGSGDVDAECDDNAVSIQFTIHYDEQKNCSVTLEQAELTRLGDFKITFEPVGFLNKIKSKLFTFGINRFSNTIRNSVNKVLAPALRTILEKVDICGYLPFEA